MHQKRGIIASLKLKFWRRSLPATLTFVGVMLGGMGYLLLTPRHYQATARLILETKSDNIAEVDLDLSAVGDRLSDRHLSLQDRARLIESKAVLTLASSELDRTLKSKAITPQQIATNLVVKPIPRENILQIDYQHRNSAIATIVVDAIAQAAIANNEKSIHEEIQSLQEFLASEVAKQEQNPPINGEEKDRLDFLKNKLAEARSAKVQLLNRLKILNLADRENIPIRPNSSLVIALAILIASCLSSTVVQILEILDNRPRENYEDLDDLEFIELYLDRQADTAISAEPSRCTIATKRTKFIAPHIEN